MKPRDLIYEGDVARVPLTKGYFAIIDFKYAELVRHWNWRAQFTKEPSQGTVCRSLNPGVLALADFINPPPIGMLNDHRDGDFLNNRIANLRFATFSANACNRAKGKTLHAYKGIVTKKNRWAAQIGLNGKHFYLGSYMTPEAAAEAYDAAARRMHGEFAAVNFPQLGERSCRE